MVVVRMLDRTDTQPAFKKRVDQFTNECSFSVVFSTDDVDALHESIPSGYGSHCIESVADRCRGYKPHQVDSRCRIMLGLRANTAVGPALFRVGFRELLCDRM